MPKHIYWPGGLFHHWWKAPLSNASFMRIVFCKLRIWIVLVLQWAWLWLIHMTDPSRATAHCSVLIKYCKSVSKGSHITQRDALQTTHQVYSCNKPRNGCKVLISQCFRFSLYLWSSQLNLSWVSSPGGNMFAALVTSTKSQKSCCKQCQIFRQLFVDGQFVRQQTWQYVTVISQNTWHGGEYEATKSGIQFRDPSQGLGTGLNLIGN